MNNDFFNGLLPEGQQLASLTVKKFTVQQVPGKDSAFAPGYTIQISVEIHTEAKNKDGLLVRVTRGNPVLDFSESLFQDANA